MANNNINPSIPIFEGRGYEAWRTKMSNLFISQELWECVEKRHAGSSDTHGIGKKDAMALYFIQQAVDETIFPRIEKASNAKVAWDELQKRYSEDSKADQIEEVMEDLKREFGDLRNPLPKNSCIYRVPKRLREVNELAYTPRLVSIGPLHCRNKNENLKQMETQKVKSLWNFKGRRLINDEKLGKIIKDIKEKEENIRNCYAEKIDYLDSVSFVKMVLLDAIFIIELFQNRRMTNDAVFVRKEDIDKDLILLENQLPFFILEDIYNHVFVTCPDSKAFKTLTLDYFKNKNKQNKLFPQDQDVKHFTDLLRYFLLPDEPRSPQESKWCTEKCLQYIRWPQATDKKEESSQVYSATELHESGVKFELRQKKCLLNIEFTDGGKLEMPCLEINDETESFFRNLMALEQCHDHYQSATKICDYILFMDFLINTTKDVELLVRKEIIMNRLGDHRTVADLLNKLSLEIMVWEDSCFSDCIRRLNKYYEVPYHSWKATLRHEYFKTPFRAASTIAAFILVVLTLLQTIFSGIAL